MQINNPVGVDGCRGGWVAASADGVSLYSGFEDLVANYPRSHFLVDIPIGLTDRQPRELDQLARQLIPGRASSVFPVPSRSAVFAIDYETACQRNVERFGKKISKQAWNICAKMREVDDLLQSSRSLRGRVAESHPEIAFFLLNRGELLPPKKTSEGIKARLSLLNETWADPISPIETFEEAMETYPRSVVARDDLLDAMVLRVTGKGATRELTGGQATDETGIPMRMILPLH